MQKFVSTRIASTRISRPSQPGQKKGWRTRVIAPHYAFPSLAWRRKVLRGGKQDRVRTPPSMTIWLPVTYVEAGEARKRAKPWISSVEPKR